MEARALVRGICGLARHVGAPGLVPAAAPALDRQQVLLVVQADDAGERLLARLLVPAPLPVRTLAVAVAVVHGTAPGALLQRTHHLLGAAVGAVGEALEVSGLTGELPACPIHSHGPALTVSDVAAVDAAALAVEVFAAEARELDAAALAQVLPTRLLRRFPGTRSCHCCV